MSKSVLKNRPWYLQLWRAYRMGIYLERNREDLAILYRDYLLKKDGNKYE